MCCWAPASWAVAVVVWPTERRPDWFAWSGGLLGGTVSARVGPSAASSQKPPLADRPFTSCHRPSTMSAFGSASTVGNAGCPVSLNSGAIGLEQGVDIFRLAYRSRALSRTEMGANAEPRWSSCQTDAASVTHHFGPERHWQLFHPASVVILRTVLPY